MPESDTSSSIHQYQIVEKMTAGSFGVVFRVERKVDGREFVMKRIPLENLDPSERQQAVKEFYVMSEMCHPFIVHQYDAFLFNDNDLCLIIEFYDGGDLDRMIKMRREEEDAFFPFRRVMYWLVQMLLAVHYLHSKGIIHRDLKTHNIFFEQQRHDLAVGDFGIAEKIESKGVHNWMMSLEHSYDNVNLQEESIGASFGMVGSGGAEDGGVEREKEEGGGRTSPPIMKGTPLYMSPELLQGAATSAGGGGGGGDGKEGRPRRTTGAGQKADMWSLGCILYELLSLRHPFYATDIALLVLRVTRGTRAPLPPHYPEEVVELVDRMLDLNPEQRPSCKEVLRMPVVSAYAMAMLEERGGILSPGATCSDQLLRVDKNATEEEEEEVHASSKASLLKQLGRLKLMRNDELVERLEAQAAEAEREAPRPSAAAERISRFDDSINAKLREAHQMPSSSLPLSPDAIAEAEDDAAELRGRVTSGTESPSSPDGLRSTAGRTSSRGRRTSSRDPRRRDGSLPHSSGTRRFGGSSRPSTGTGEGGLAASPVEMDERDVNDMILEQLCGVDREEPGCPEWWGAPNLENVEDVADASLSEIAAEVEVMRRLVQTIYRQRAQQRSTLRLLREYASDGVEASPLPSSLGRMGASGGLSYSLRPGDVEMAAMGGGPPLLAVQRELIEEADETSRNLAGEVEQWAAAGAGVGADVHSPPAGVLAAVDEGAASPLLLHLLGQREELYASLFPDPSSRRPSRGSETTFPLTAAVAFKGNRGLPFTRDVFESVYQYYDTRDVLRRDPHAVRRLVPNRQSWPFLPVIDAIVRLDQWLRRSLAATNAAGDVGGD